jgi:hypothetical protein
MDVADPAELASTTRSAAVPIRSYDGSNANSLSMTSATVRLPRVTSPTVAYNSAVADEARHQPISISHTPLNMVIVAGPAPAR